MSSANVLPYAPPGEIPDKLFRTYMAKSVRAMKVLYAVKRITFDTTEANPGNTLYVSVPKLNQNEVLVPGSLALRFDIDLESGHVNNFLVKNVTCVLVDKLVMKFTGATLQDTVGYDIYKMFEDLFLPVKKRDIMVQEGMQIDKLNKIRLKARDKASDPTETKLNKIFGSKY